MKRTGNLAREWIGAHWFIPVALFVVAGDLMATLPPTWDDPRALEVAVLPDLAVLLPALYWACYRDNWRRAALRTAALACLGVWAASHLGPEQYQRLLVEIAPIRNIGVAVLLVVELRLVYLVWRSVFAGRSADETETSLASKGIPPFLTRLIAWEARIGQRVANWIKGLFGR